MERCGCKIDWDKRGAQTTEEKMDELAKVMTWCGENAPESIKPWTPFEHPQLGMVEIGGVEFKFTNQNPPKQFLLQEVEKTTRFCLRYAKSLPKLAIEDVKCVKQADGIYKVEALISNTGYLPTYLSEEAKALKKAKEVEVTLKGAEAFISGKSTEKIGHLEGFSAINTDYNRNAITTGNYDPIVKKVVWIIKATQQTELTISAVSQKAGKAAQKFVCE